MEDSEITKLERKSLGANDYAAVKELNAFMKFADGDRIRYKNTRIDLEAGKANNRFDAYTYCFLFGMFNQNGKIRSFGELKDLVANAVYMQACSPIHDRNNSREDNTIKHITYKSIENGEKYLRRFGGIGCGELVYPYEKVKRYYALKWAAEVMEERWKEYDRKFYEKEKEQRRLRKAGRKYVQVERGTEYLKAIEMADQTDILAEDIRMSCRSEEGTFRWNDYLDALWREVQYRLEQEKKENEEKDEADENIFNYHLGEINTKIQGIWFSKSYRDVMQSNVEKCKEIITVYKRMEALVLAMGEATGERFGSFWCRLHSLTEEQPSYEMEYWLNTDGNFMHPNGVRYFLYQLQKEIGKRVEAEKEKIAKLQLGIQDLTKQDETQIKKKRKIFKQVYRKYSGSLKNLYDCAEHIAYKKVLEQCDGYVERLIKNYEYFYDNYNELLEEFKEECKLLEEEFQRTKGTIQAYVCVDQECRDKIFNMLHERQSFMQTGTVLSYRIFELMQNQIQNRSKSGDLSMQFKNHWVENLEREYSDILDMNILHAIDMEELCKNGRKSDAIRMKGWIEQVKKNLIAPFLQYSKESGEQQGISICCYNDELLNEHGYFKDVVRWLDDQESVHDSFYCSKYQLMFYRSFVGLDADEVLDYIHYDENKGEGGGDAFLSYQDTLDYMGKNAIHNAQITPHIDKGWHSYLNLPDSDLQYQKYKELEIAQAFLYAVLQKKFRHENNLENNKKDKYYYTVESDLVEFPNLMEFHRYLYENNWQVRRLNDELYRRIAEERAKQNNLVDNLIDNYEDGIFGILLQYFDEIELYKQDRFMYKLLLEAVWQLILMSREGESDVVSEDCRMKMKSEWDKIKDNDNKNNARLQSFIKVAESFFRENKIPNDEG